MSGIERSANTTLYEIIGLSKERADEIARSVRSAFSESNSPSEWIRRLADEFDIESEDAARIFACGWFAGKYAGVSEVFSTVQKEMDRRESDLMQKRERQSRHSPPDGYA